MSNFLHGDHAARMVSQRIHAQVASLTVLKQTPAQRRNDGMVVHVQADDTLWQWANTATATGDDVLAVAANDAPTAGRWMRMPGAALLALTFYATTVDGTALLTVPSNTILQPLDVAVRLQSPSTIFTGVAGSMVGLSSTNHAGHTGVANFSGSFVGTQLNQVFSATAAGTGMAFHMLVASGTFDTVANKRLWMKGGDTFRHDAKPQNFGTGIGQWLVACNILQNPGV